MSIFPEYENMTLRELQDAKQILKICAATTYGKFTTSARCVLGFPIVMHTPNLEYFNRLRTISDRMRQLKRRTK